eukprot:GHVL01004763.1.p1 GENE.GHVL01004763.1~~GHVL01004763.1.p1  ORF type:complete len:185 (+),score=25.68 GHVL01004763.1:67-621(+)
MGNLSACCSVDPASETQKHYIDEEQDAPEPSASEQKKPDNAEKRPRPKSQRSASNQGNKEAFHKQMLKGMIVNVLLHEGTSLECELILKDDPPTLQVKYQEKIRNIPFEEIKSLLYGPEALKRVETQADLTKEDKCVAIQLINGNCIPIKFVSKESKSSFIQLVTDIMKHVCNASASHAAGFSK